MAKSLTYNDMIALSKDKVALKARIAEVAIENKAVKPYIYHEPQTCNTCKSINREEHPDTGYCFICDTDNWDN